MRLRVWVTRLVRLLVVPCLAAALWGMPRPAQAAAILVTTTAEAPGASGDCTLGEAIQAAQTNTAVDACPAGGGDDTIVLQAGATYTLTTAAYDLNGPSAFGITGTLTINGQGATLARGPATDSLRFFYVDGGTLTLKDLTLRGGLARGAVGAAAGAPNAPGQPGIPASGGAVLNNGSLVLDGVRFEANVAQGGHGGAGDGLGSGGVGASGSGGAIVNADYVAIVGAGAEFVGNQALGGQGGAGSPGGKGGGALGAAINNNGALAAEAPARFEANVARGGLGGNGSGLASLGGEGGTVIGGTLSNTASASLTGAVFRYNAALGGSGGLGLFGRSEGGSVSGGLLYNALDGAELSLAHSLIYSNTAQGGVGRPGGNLFGGVLYQNHNAVFNLSYTRVLSNTATGGDAVGGLEGVGGGAFGAFSLLAGTAHIQQSALVGNAVLTGTSNLTTTSAISLGGGLYVSSAAVRLTNTTVAHNQAAGSSVLYSYNPITLTHVTVAHNISTSGGAAMATVGNDLWLYNSLVAYNTGSNCSSVNQALVSANLQYPGDTCGAGVSTADPLLGALTALGGMPHLPLLTASPARDTAAGACPPVDQRGFPRPIGAACDLGAIEAWGALFLPFIKR